MRAILMLLWWLLLSIEATDDGSLYEDKILLIHMQCITVILLFIIIYIIARQYHFRLNVISMYDVL